MSPRDTSNGAGRTMVRSLTDLEPVRAYLNRIGAEQRSLRTAVVKVSSGKYWKDLATIHFSSVGEVTVKGAATAEYKPTAEEQKEIADAWDDFDWPTHAPAYVDIVADHPVKMKEMMDKAGPDNVFRFHDDEGGIVLIQVRVEDENGGKSYQPWTFWSDDQWRNCEGGGPLPIYNAHRLKNVAEVWLHEGAKAAARVQEMVDAKTPAAIEALARHPWRKHLTTAAHLGWIGGASSPHRTDWTALARAGLTYICVVADNDPEGAEAARYIGARLPGSKTLEWPPDRVPPHFDLGDPVPEAYLPLPPFLDLLRPPPYLGLANVAEHTEPVAKVAERLNDHGLAFQFGGAATLICREASGVLKDREGKPHVSVRAVRATAQALVLKVEAVSSWSAMDGRKKALVPKPVPMWLPQTLIELRGEGLAPLAGVAYHPLIWQGQLLAKRLGYHRPTQLFIDAEPIEPELFTDTKAALEFLLNDWIKPFPFKAPDDGLRALLLPLALLLRRTGVMGGAPLLFATSPERNTGKTYLVLCLRAAVLGAEPGVMTFSEDEEELRKSLMAALIESPPVIFYDNLRNGAAVRHVALDRYATAETYADRRLGATETVTVPTTSTLVFSGNNIAAVGDLASRHLEIRLERRPGGNGAMEMVLARTKELRPKILGALLAIAQTPFEDKHTSRFPSWERVVARPLMAAAGSETMLDALIEQDDGLEENALLGDLLDAMAKIQKAQGERDDAPEVEVWLTATNIADGCPKEFRALTGRRKDRRKEEEEEQEQEKISVNRVTQDLRPWRDRQGSNYRLRMRQEEKNPKGKKPWRYRAEEQPM